MDFIEKSGKDESAFGDYLMYVSAAPGDTLCLDASRSHDADNDSISFVWKIYEEAGDMRGAAIGNPTGEKCTVSIPKSERGKSLHVILEVSDNGSPSLTSYKRIVILTNQDDIQQL